MIRFQWYIDAARGQGVQCCSECDETRDRSEFLTDTGNISEICVSCRELLAGEPAPCMMCGGDGATVDRPLCSACDCDDIRLWSAHVEGTTEKANTLRGVM